MMAPKGSLYIVSAPSGAGKTSLVEALVAKTPDLLVSVSHTTRLPRPGEKEGVNYFFTTLPDFERMVSQQDFLEHANVFGHSYGTSKGWVETQLAQGKDVILEIDWQGARQIKWMIPESIGIFILPPSLPALKIRLQRRGKDEREVIDLRMSQAQLEMSHYEEYEFLVINDVFERALEDLKAIILSRRLTLSQQVLKQHQLIQDLCLEIHHEERG
jgi:guanylate kinase